MEIVPYESKHITQILVHQEDLYSLNFKNIDFLNDTYLYTIKCLYERLSDSAFVLIHNNKVAGFYLYEIYKEEALLMQIYIALEYRHLGFGKQLMIHFEDQVRNSGGVNIELDVSMMNAKSVAFYKKNGYETQQEYEASGELRQHLFKNLNKQFTKESMYDIINL